MAKWRAYFSCRVRMLSETWDFYCFILVLFLPRRLCSRWKPQEMLEITHNSVHYKHSLLYNYCFLSFKDSPVQKQDTIFLMLKIAKEIKATTVRGGGNQAAHGDAGIPRAGVVTSIWGQRSR